MRLPQTLFTISAFALATASAAHELWIEPTDYTIDRGASIEANLFNGEEFAGSRLAYFPQRFAAFRYFLGTSSAPVTGRIGDAPAVNVAPLADGLHVIAYLSTPAVLDYQEWEKFQRFVDHKDLGEDVRAQHDARGLPETGFNEVYIRCSKSLIGVGSAAGADLRTGMETELVALANPYVDDVSGGFPVQLFYQNGVRANEQVELFEKAPDGTVRITLHRTDDQGIATLPVRAGYSYMVDAVVLREPSPERAEQFDAVWETLWANLTFEIPAE